MLETLVGINQVFNTSEYPLLEDDLVQSDSGLYLESVNFEYLKTDKILEYLPLFEVMDFPEYQNSASYSTGEKAKRDGSLIIAKQDIADTGTSFNPDLWESAYSYRLREIKSKSLQNFLNDLSNKRNLVSGVNKLKRYSNLFYARNKAQERTIQNDRFNCVKLMVNSYDTIEINEVGMYVTQPQTLTYYLYHSDKEDFIESRDIDFTASDVNQFKWKKLDTPIKIQYSTENAGGVYLWGFRNNDLQGNYYTWDYIGNYSCHPCHQNEYNFQSWYTYRQYFGLTPITYPQTNTELPDIGEYFDNYNDNGEIPFNLKMKVYEDNTYILDENPEFIQRAIQYKLAVDILTAMRYSIRINGDTTKQNEIDQILNGGKRVRGSEGDFQETYNSGVRKMYEKIMEETLNNLSTILPDNRGFYV